MNQYLSPEVSSSDTKYLRVVIFVVCALLLLIVGAISIHRYSTFIYQGGIQDDQDQVASIETPDSFTSIPPSSLVISYTAINDTVPKLYAYRHYPIQVLIPVLGTEYIQAHAEFKDGRRVFGSQDEDGQAIIQIVSSEHALIDTYYLGVIGQVSGLLWNEMGSKILLSVTPDGSTMLSESTLIVVDLSSGEQIQVGKGVSPQFLNDEEIIAIRDDGVYKYEIQTKDVDSVHLVYSFESNIVPSVHTKSLLSNDKKNVVITHPTKGIVQTLSFAEDAQTLSLKENVEGVMYAPAKTANEGFVVFVYTDVTQKAQLMRLDTNTKEVIKFVELPDIDLKKPFTISF